MMLMLMLCGEVYVYHCTKVRHTLWMYTSAEYCGTVASLLQVVLSDLRRVVPPDKQKERAGSSIPNIGRRSYHPAVSVSGRPAALGSGTLLPVTNTQYHLAVVLVRADLQ